MQECEDKIKALNEENAQAIQDVKDSCQKQIEDLEGTIATRDQTIEELNTKLAEVEAANEAKIGEIRDM